MDRAREPSRNLGLDLVRATEAAALAAGRWMGLGEPLKADQTATEKMYEALNLISFEGAVAVGEGPSMLACDHLSVGQCVGTGEGPGVDIVVDPVDGRGLVAQGHPGAIAVMAGAPQGAFWSPDPASTVHMEKIVVDCGAAEALVPECLDAPAAWTMGLIARAKGKEVQDVTVTVLDRPWHTDLVDELRQAGVHVMLRNEGDVTGALLAGMEETGIDALMGTGGSSEGLIAACALKATGGAILARLKPQNDQERAIVEAAEFDHRRTLSTDDLVRSEAVFFAATGITDGPLLDGIQYAGNRARSNSLILRGETKTRRTIHAEHLLHEASGRWDS